MAAGLALSTQPTVDVSDFVSVSILIDRAAAQYRDFGIGLVMGSTPGVIDTAERLRLYTGLNGVQQDFGSTAPETQAAQLYFSQSPQPAVLVIGRFAQTATKGHIRGATLSTLQQLLSNFNTIANGSLSLSIDGTVRNITGINLASPQPLNLNAVASTIQTALQAVVPNAGVKWDAGYRRFEVSSGSTGTSSSVGYATAAPSGTDLGPLLHLTSADASAPVQGIAPETPLSALAALTNISSAWYALLLAPAAPLVDADVIAVASFIEGIAASKARIFAGTLQNANVLDPTQSADVMSSLQTLGLSRSCGQYSSTNPFASASMFARIATVNWEGSNTTITLAYKNEPGVAAEGLNESQFATLKAKNCNVFLKVSNGTSILFPGVMANGDYIDERVGADWFQNRAQTDVYNLMYTSPTKVPQDDSGSAMIANVLKAVCEIAVGNGLVAEGIWRGPPIGPINTGDNLPKGYHIYYPPVATQSAADRAARRSVLFQILLVFKGAIHLVNIAAIFDR